MTQGLGNFTRFPTLWFLLLACLMTGFSSIWEGACARACVRAWLLVKAAVAACGCGSVMVVRLLVSVLEAVVEGLCGGIRVGRCGSEKWVYGCGQLW